jgi:hypothetical protein
LIGAMRLALILLVIAARAAHADPRAMAVELGASAVGWTGTLVPADGSQFPAVSEDGRVIVELFHDRADFVGQPLATVVFFSRGQRAAAIALASDATPVANRAQRRIERRALAEINERLGRARWQPLAVVVPTPSDHDAGSTTELDDGVHVAFNVGYVFVTRDGSRTARLERRFTNPGGTCARIVGVDRIFGSRATGFLVAVPRFDADGEVCIAPPSADLAIAVPIP